jgi:hypothetical protein
MGLLSDIRSGNRGFDGDGAAAVIFWIVAGAVLGFGVAQAAANPIPERAVNLLTLVGGVLGAVVGFYAALGASLVARVLAIPGLIIGFLIGVAR